jgi:hypothetical protein
VKDSVLFNVSEEELEQFESIVHEHQIAHSALFLEELTARNVFVLSQRTFGLPTDCSRDDPIPSTGFADSFVSGMA